MNESVRFEDKVVIITGAGGGLGRAHALLFAAQGAKVLVNDLGGSAQGGGANASAADRVVAEIRQAGGIAEANHDSVTDGIRSTAVFVEQRHQLLRGRHESAWTAQ